MLQAPVILDADMSVIAALGRLRSYPGHALVVVRRQRDLEIFFHVFTVEALQEELRAGAPARGSTDTVGRVLGLDLRPASPTRQLEDGDASDATFGGVLLDGLAILGVVRPNVITRTRAAAPRVPEEAVGRGGGFLARMGGGLGHRRTRGRAPEAVPPGMTGDGEALGELESTRAWTGEVALPSSTLEEESVAEPAAAPMRRFEAHPRLELEHDVVEPGQRFELTVGLAREAVQGVSGSLITASIPSNARHLDLDVQVVADEFQAPAGWYFRLRVPVDAPESAQIAVPLVAPEGEVTRQTLLEVHFSHAGAPAGVAFRRIGVRAAAVPSVPGAGEPWLRPTAAPAILIDPADPPPDLWITISKPDGNEATGRFLWSFQSPHDIELPRSPLPMDLGHDAPTFAARIVRLVTENEGSELIDEALVGLGRQIAEKAPAELGLVLSRLRAAIPASDRAPTILLQSAEAHVPWELALLDDPPDPTLPPLLGAQFAVGRWLLGPRTVRIPPAREVVVRSMVVVAGDYKSSRRLRLLPQAEAEGDALVARYGAARMAATAPELNRLLAGDSQAIHFACHGEVDPGDPATGRIFLDDDQPLDPIHFLQAEVGRRHQPFLFLNACQVGQAGELLGDYAGFAGSCLRNAFRGFIAPLWSVDDEIAHAIALEFYESAFGDEHRDPIPVGEVLRRIRARFPRNDSVAPSTWLAYVFYGNPNLILRRA